MGGGNRPMTMEISGGIIALFETEILPARRPFPAPLPPRLFYPVHPSLAYGALADDLECHLDHQLPGDRRFYNPSRMSESSNQPLIIDSCRGLLAAGSMEVVQAWHRGYTKTQSGHLRHARWANTISADGPRRDS